MLMPSRVVCTCLLALILAGCTGGSESAEVNGSKLTANQPGFDDLQTPPPVVIEKHEPAADTSAPPSESATTAATEAPVSATTPAESEQSKESEAPTEEPKEPLPPRESLAGRWEFVICNFGADILKMLIDVQQDGDAWTAKIAAESPVMPAWTIESATITDKTAAIQFATPEGVIVDFAGELQEDGIVRGNMLIGDGDLALVRLMATELESLDKASPQVPSLGVEKMEGFDPTEETLVTDLREKAKELGTSSLAFTLYRTLAGVIRAQRPDEEKFSGLPEEYLAAVAPWGQRATDRTQLDIAYTMAVAGYSPSEARQYLTKAQEAFGDEAASSIQQRLAIAAGLIDLESEDAGVQKQGMEALQAVRTDNPQNTDAALGLAAYFERSKQPEEALALYAELSALPTGAGDIDQVVRLWNELGRDPEEVDAYLNEIYKQHVHQFAAASSDAPRAEGNQQVILGELFTGMTCPPCVAADIAIGGLEITYPQDAFIVLRYHQHVPGPDSLAVAAGDERAREYYRIQGTPSLYFNGQPVQVAGMYGPYGNAPIGYAELQPLVDQLLTQSSELTIEAAAEASDGKITITANVTGVDEFPPTWRLRLALAEDEIFFPAANGVRLHEMVVRSMPGGAEGIAPENGTLSYTETISLDDVRHEIESFIGEIKGLPLPPLELLNLKLVAFVQNDANRRVMQAISIPVTGLSSDEESGEDAQTPPADATPADEADDAAPAVDSPSE